MTRKEKIIYAAGLFDGEGCVILQNNVCPKRGVQLVVRLVIGMTTPYGPELFAALFGGNVRLQKKRGKRRPVFDWRTSCSKAEVVLCALLPYLREKRAQAEVALAIREIQKGHKDGKNHNEKTQQQVAQLGQKLHDLKHVSYVQ